MIVCASSYPKSHYYSGDLGVEINHYRLIIFYSSITTKSHFSNQLSLPLVLPIGIEIINQIFFKGILDKVTHPSHPNGMRAIHVGDSRNDRFYPLKMGDFTPDFLVNEYFYIDSED